MHWFIFFLCSILYAEQIELGTQILEVELATTHETRSRGLMGRKKLTEGTGMLFVYTKSEPLVFWMKNTLIPLSIAFFNEDREMINTIDMNVPQKGLPLQKYYSEGPALYALEVPQGWFTKHGIGPGDKFSFLDPVNEIE